MDESKVAQLTEARRQAAILCQQAEVENERCYRAYSDSVTAKTAASVKLDKACKALADYLAK